jgi:anti-sigma factor RsiW
VNACDSRDDLGAYALEGLTPAEREDVEAHVATCQGCRRELVELEKLPALLALAADAPPAPPERVRYRVLAQAGARRARRRLVAVAAAVALLGALVGGTVTAVFLAPGTTAVAVGLRAVEPFDPQGWVVLRESPGGVTVELELHDLEPPPSGGVYEAWLSTHDEERVSLGDLDPDGAGTAMATLEAAGSLASYRSFWVTLESGGAAAHDGPTVAYGRLP